MVPLGLMGDGEAGEIVDLREGAAGRRAAEGRMEDLGLRVGKQVEVLSNRGSALVVRVDAARIALGRGAAMRIAVRRSGT